MSDNKILHKCTSCLKSYKSDSMLKKHKCKKDAMNTPIEAVPESMSEEQKKMLAQQKVNELVQQKKMENLAKAKAAASGNAVASENTSGKENTYDVNMTFMENNKVKVEMKKQGEDSDSDSDSDKGDENVLKDLVRPKISTSYQDEIDKLENLVQLFKNMPISEDPDKKDRTIEQLKQTITILMEQSKKLIKEMQTMSKRNSYYRNNVTLAAFILDRCRKDAPETDEEFEEMFGK